MISVKFGALRGPDNRFAGKDGRPAAVANFLAYSLRRLGPDHVDIYRPARPGPDVPIEETVGAIAEQVEAGYVGHIGLSEIGAETLRRAHAVHPICDVQLEYSVLARSAEASVLPACRELGVAVTAYGVLARGLLSGHWSPDRRLDPGDIRAHSPRFVGENLHHNLALVDAAREIAERQGSTVAELAIAWVLAPGDDNRGAGRECGGVRSWRRRSGRSARRWMRRRSRRSRPPSRRGSPSERAIPKQGWHSSTAYAERRSAPRAGRRAFRPSPECYPR